MFDILNDLVHLDADELRTVMAAIKERLALLKEREQLAKQLKQFK